MDRQTDRHKETKFNASMVRTTVKGSKINCDNGGKSDHKSSKINQFAYLLEEDVSKDNIF
jgi:hypothetical protein